jgi:hypothetical protein
MTTKFSLNVQAFHWLGTKRFDCTWCMPTALQKDGFAVMICLNDHRPAHVPVFKAEGELVVYLGNATTPPSVRINIDVSKADERKALMIVGEHQAELLQEWRRIHG